jgi:hypothetical protein
MKAVKAVFLLVVIAVVLMAGSQIGLAEWGYLQFRDELHDLAGNAGENIGLVVPRSDEQLRNLIVDKAARHDIQLDPQQVTIHRTGTKEWPTYDLEASYDVPIRLPGYTFLLHFSVSSAKK